MTERGSCVRCGAPVSGARCFICGEAVAVSPPNWDPQTFNPQTAGDGEPDDGWTEWPYDGRTPLLIRPYVPTTSPPDDRATAEFDAAPPSPDPERRSAAEPDDPGDMYDWPAEEPDTSTDRSHLRTRAIVATVLVALAVLAGVRLLLPLSDEGTDGPEQRTDPGAPIVVDPSLGPPVMPSTAIASGSGSASAAPPASAAPVLQDPSRTTPPVGGTSAATSASTGQPVTPRTVSIAGGAGRCIDNGYGRQVDQNPVVIFQCNGGDAQRWTFNPNGTVSIGSFCLQISYAYIANHGLTQIATCTGSQNQQWRPRPDRTLLHVATGLCLFDATSSGKGVMNPYTGTYWGEVVQCTGAADQRWST
jgi:hypothetical protein